jgi:hypothetical protein
MNLGINPFSTSSVKETVLGQKYSDGNGRTWRYAKAGASGLSRGKLMVQATTDANYSNLSWTTAPTAGAKTVTVTVGASVVTADQFQDGWLVVQDGTGEGRAYPISGNLACGSAGNCTVYLKEAIDTTGVLAETGCDLVPNKYSGVVVSVADQADQALGVPNVAVTAAYYFWLQTGGPCSVLMDEAIAVGLTVTIGSSVVGAVEALDGAGEQAVGVMDWTAGVDTEYQLVNLTLDSSIQ